MKKAVLHILLILVAGISSLLNNAWGQTDLVRWNGGNNDFAPIILASNITATNITNYGGGSLSNNGQWNQFFQTGGWPNPSQNGGYLNPSRYVEFSITPAANYKIDLDQFNFEVQMDGGSANFEVRYSKDFSQSYSSFTGTINSSWGAKSGSLSGVNPVLPGETVQIRLYIYNTYNSLRIKHSWGGTTGPVITGTVSTAVTADPTDLGVTQTISNATPNTGDQVTFTITAENNGPNAATGASVTDLLPPGFAYINANAPAGTTYNNTTGKWNIGDFANGDTKTLQIIAQMQVAGPHTNTATIAHYGSDPVSGNNSASITPDNVCAGTHTIPSGNSNITVNPGEIYCLYSGTYNGAIVLKAGGTVCISKGAVFTPNTYSDFDGEVINKGMMTLTLNQNRDYLTSIVNYGKFTASSIQKFKGAINNYDTINITGAYRFETVSHINNYGYINLNANGHALGKIENSGVMAFANGANIDGTINNYKKMMFNGSVNILSSTYYTNDDSLIFQGITSAINFQGPMLTNNAFISITGGSNASLGFNSNLCQVYNNGKIFAQGQVSHNAAGSKLVNNCTIECAAYVVGNGTSENNGLINTTASTNSFQVNGGPSYLKNGAGGYIQGTDLTNSGHITGYGTFYFTGYTNNNGGSIIGDEPNSIAFFDASQTGGNILDAPGSILNNVIRPGTMTPLNTTSFNCTGPQSVAGFPPNTDTVSRTYCTPPSSLTFNLHDYVSGYNNTYTVQYGSIKLFTEGVTTPANPLVIANKGTFSADTTTGIITFTPDPAFASGSVSAQYRISNTHPGDAIIYPSAKTQITITRSCNNDYTPATSTIDTSFCGADSVLLNMNNYINAHAPVDGFSFSLQWNTLKLFDPANPGNPGNGSSSVHITNTGTFTITQTNPGQITFYPETGFTGTATAQYQITNIWNKNNETFTSDKTTISAHGSNIPAPNIQTPHTF